jgi:predicted phosphodiesterase
VAVSRDERAAHHALHPVLALHRTAALYRGVAYRATLPLSSTGGDRAGARMKIAILSDVHADLAPLVAARRIADERGCEEILCAGDVVGYGPESDAVVALLRERGVATARGNHDRWLVERVRRAGGGPDAVGREAVGGATYEYLAALRDVVRLNRADRRIAVCHGAPGNDMEQVLADRTDAQACAAYLDRANADILVVGHTHVPAVIAVAGRGLIVNPGALLRSLRPGGWVPAPGTFGLLDAARLTFEVVDTATGRAVEPVRRSFV